jgi:hypothetical protein
MGSMTRPPSRNAARLMRLAVERPGITPRVEGQQLLGAPRQVMDGAIRELKERELADRRGIYSGAMPRLSIYPSQKFWDLHATVLEDVHAQLDNTPLGTLHEEAVKLLGHLAANDYDSDLIPPPLDDVMALQWQADYEGRMLVLSNNHDLNDTDHWFPGIDGWRLLVSGEAFTPS